MFGLTNKLFLDYFSCYIFDSSHTCELLTNQDGFGLDLWGEKDILSPLVDHRKAKMAASNDEVKRHEPGSYYKSAETCRNGKVGLG